MSFRALESAENAIWAMEETALARLLSIAAREHDITPEALEAYEAKRLAGTEKAEVRDGVAIINVTGDLFKRANLFTAVSGATSYDILRRDFQAALDDPKVKAVLFNVDSPGGEASGTAELAAAVYAARGTKPIQAYVNGTAASAAYWIVAAVDPGGVTVDPTALLGSIGVQMALRNREDPKGTTTYRFVSSQSPMKNADPGTEAGASHIQSIADAMGQVFVSSVATYRGVDTETVLSRFGKGGIFVGKDAVEAGLADRVGNFEGVLAELSATRRSAKTKGAKMADETTYTAADVDARVTAAVNAAIDASNARVAGINRVAAGFNLSPADIAAAVASGVTVEAFALAQSDAAATARASAAEAERVRAAAEAAKPEAERQAALTALQSDEQRAAVAAASTGNEPDEESIDAVAARIAAA